MSYLYILSGQYEKLIDIANSKTEEVEQVDSEIFKINLQFALKKQKNDFDDVCLRNLTAKTSDQKIRLGAFAVLGQEKEVKRIMKDLIKNDFINYYLFKQWPIIDQTLIEELKIDIAA